MSSASASSPSFQDLQTQYNNLYAENQYALGQRSRFSYTYKPVPFPGDFFNDIKTTYIGTFTPDQTGANAVGQYMVELPMQQTPKTCILNAAVAATKYINENTLDTSAFGGSFVASTLKAPTVTRTDLVRNTTDEVITTGGVEKYSVKGLNFMVVSGRYYDNGYNNGTDVFKNPAANGLTVEIDTSKVDITTPGLILPQNFGSLETSTATNAKNVSSPTTQSIKTSDNAYELFMIEWVGIFTPNVTGNWTFYTSSDDYSLLWVDSDGTSIKDSYSMNNLTVDNRGLHGTETRWGNPLPFTAGNDYTIRIRFGENGGGNIMAVGVKNPSGVTTTDFTGLFFTKATKDTTRTETKTNVSYTTGASKSVGGGSLAGQYNSGYTTSDPNPVYVAMARDSTTGMYKCYMNQPTNGNLGQVLSSGANNSKFIIKNIWQSNQVGTTYFNGAKSPGVVTLSEGAGLFMDTTTQITTSSNSTGASNVPNVTFKDKQCYMFIGENQRTTGSKVYFVPSVVIVDVANKKKWTLDLSLLTSDANITKFYPYQVPNLAWTSNPQFLVYDIDGIGDNTSAVLALNSLVKIYGNYSISSPNGYFNLTMVNGKLTIQMVIDPTLDLTGTTDAVSGLTDLKYVEKDIAPNTYPVLKVNINSNIDKLNLYDTQVSAGFVVPKSYTQKSASTYTQYEGAYPYVSSTTSQTNVTTDNAAGCKAKCDADTKCDAYYTYKKNNQTACKLQTFSDPADPAFFNPVPKDGTITNSTLFIKNKEIKPDYNVIDTNINTTVLGKNQTMYNTKLPYYPDTPSKNMVGNSQNYFDVVKKNIKDTDKALSDFQNNPKNYTTSINIAPVIDMKTYTSSKTKVGQGYSDYLSLLEKNKEGFTSTREGFATREGLTSLALDPNLMSSTDYESASTALQSGICNYGWCNALNSLQSTNTNYNTITTNDAALSTNRDTIKAKISEVDAKFKELSDLKTSDGSVNPYASDFNSLDDTPDTTINTRISKDTNEMLMYHNSLYTIGTITTAAILILAISLAR
jgi:hypothetical protein